MTTGAGDGRRRVWRWAVLVWAVAVAAGGALTVWLQESAEPPGPYRWEEATPTPLSRQDGETHCPEASAPPRTGDGSYGLFCVVRAG
ncbi:hypothetical protein ACIHCM_23615 [Streptomyces sp. NPDC052023]|uniref:hypothetical protein n=1 Tax=Streptomyces sp. NPDC052023 TaxID=3365681 RepID=UPI0037D26F9E